MFVYLSSGAEDRTETLSTALKDNKKPHLLPVAATVDHVRRQASACFLAHVKRGYKMSICISIDLSISYL